MGDYINRIIVVSLLVLGILLIAFGIVILNSQPPRNEVRCEDRTTRAVEQNNTYEDFIKRQQNDRLAFANDIRDYCYIVISDGKTKISRNITDGDIPLGWLNTTNDQIIRPIDGNYTKWLHCRLEFYGGK